LAHLLCSVSQIAMAQANNDTVIALDPNLVQGAAVTDGPLFSTLGPRKMSLRPALDGGEMLRPASPRGACPNRMDTPTAMASFNRADEIFIEESYSTVNSGPGESGGVIDPQA
jgi:hypothetical protein